MLNILFDGGLSSRSPLLPHQQSRRPQIFAPSKDGMYVRQGSASSNENCRNRFKDTNDKIACRHLITMWLIDRFVTRSVDYDNYKYDKIGKHVRVDTEQIRAAVLEQPQTIIPSNHLIGQYFTEMFRNMETTGKAEMGGFMTTATHAMGFALSIERDPEGNNKYALSFYDPNSTRTHVEMTHHDFLDLSELASLSVRDLLIKEQRNHNYFGDSDTCALSLFDADLLEKNVKDSSSGKPVHLQQLPTKSAVTDFTIDTLNPSHVFHLLANGCDQNLKEMHRIFEHIQKTDPGRFLRLLAAKCEPNEICGIQRAIIRGHGRSLAAWAELFKLVPSKDRSAFLIEVVGGAMQNAMQSGHAGVIKEFAKLLNMIPSEKRIQVLERVTRDGLKLAIKNGHADVIHAFKELIALLPKVEHEDFLHHLIEDTLGKALCKGDTEAIRAHKELLTLIPVHRRIALLYKVVDRRGVINQVSAALQYKDKHAAIIDAIIALSDVLPSEDRSAFFLHIVDEKDIAFSLNDPSIGKKLSDLMTHNFRALSSIKQKQVMDFFLRLGHSGMPGVLPICMRIIERATPGVRPKLISDEASLRKVFRLATDADKIAFRADLQQIDLELSEDFDDLLEEHEVAGLLGLSVPGALSVEERETLLREFSTVLSPRLKNKVMMKLESLGLLDKFIQDNFSFPDAPE